MSSRQVNNKTGGFEEMTPSTINELSPHAAIGTIRHFAKPKNIEGIEQFEKARASLQRLSESDHKSSQHSMK